MRQLLGAGLVLTGLGLGLFVGGYLMLYGGIVQFIDGVTADPVSGNDVALGVIRALFFEVGAILAGIGPFLAGVAIADD